VVCWLPPSGSICSAEEKVNLHCASFSFFDGMKQVPLVFPSVD